MICGGTAYPWMPDKRWTHAWNPDRGALDSTANIATWSPAKSALAWTASGTQRPSWSAARGTKNNGMITFNGTAHLLINDAFGALLTGNSVWTVIVCFKLVSGVAFAEILSLSDTSNTVDFDAIQVDNSSPKVIRSIATDASGNTRTYLSTTNASAGTWETLTVQRQSDGSTAFRTNAAASTGTHASTGVGWSQTISRATLGAFRGATTSNFCNMALGPVIAAVGSTLSDNEVKAAETSMINMQT